jgi:O-antigen/teichoic acid export membrane protein
MSKKENSYNQILKSTSLFGGVQVITIIISIIKSKFIAILLGPTGIGIVGLFNTTLNLITSISNFGIERSAVKNISGSNTKESLNDLAKIIKVTKFLVWITGTFAFLITLLFSSFLSKITFGNVEYRYAFLWLSITLLFNQVSSGQLAVLRGLRKLKYLALSSMIGSFAGLFISVPLYYIYGIDGIVPAIVLSSIIALLTTTYFSNKIKFKAVIFSLDILKTEGKEILLVGLSLSLSSIIVVGVSYFIRIYINKVGTISDVGLYNAGFTIIGAYFGLFFTSLTTDYYPRLSRVAKKKKERNELMNEQSEMTILFLSPILVIFLVFIKLIIIILYSNEFSAINVMIMWSALGMFFKAASYAIGIIYISLGDTRTLLYTEILSNSILLASSIFFYKIYGIDGLGISFLICFLLTFVINFLIIKKKYGFYYSEYFKKIFLVQFLIGMAAFVCMLLIDYYWNYIIGSFLIIISLLYSLRELNDKLNIIKYLKKKFSK